MNGEVCCILSVCCPPLSAKQQEAFAKEIQKGTGCKPDEAKEFAKWTLENFDLAPLGSLTALKDTIGKLARHSKE